MSDMSHIVELHLHLDGSLRPETVWELAKEQGVELPAKSAEEVKYMMEVPEDVRLWKNIWNVSIFRYSSYRRQMPSSV